MQWATLAKINVLLVLLPSSKMGSEDETELTHEEQERRMTLPLIKRLMSEQHHQRHKLCESNAPIQQLQQEVDELYVSNVQRLQVEAEALDLRADSHALLSAADRKALMASPLSVRDHLDAQQGRPVSDHPTTRGTTLLLGLMMNPVMSHLNSLVKLEAGELLPPFCLLTHNLPPMSLKRAKVVGSAIPPSTSVHSAQSGTRHLPGATHTSSLNPEGL
jgi:hypothetical protein